MADILQIISNSYPYFIFCLIFLLVFGFGVLLFPEQRRATWRSAALSTPFSLATLFLVPCYWQPQRLGNLMVGVEDLIFSFTTGGIAWILAVLCWQRRIRLPREMKPSWRRYLSCIAGSSFIFGVFRFLGLSFMVSTLGTIYCMGFFLCAIQRRLWFLALGGGLFFLLLYASLFKGFLYYRPHFLGQWNPEAMLGLMGGVPLQELAWALGFGLTWPLYMTYVFGVQAGEQ